MPLPIVAVDPLGAKKRLLGMGLARKAPFNTEIGAEADEEDALVLSRYALIGGVEQAENNIVFGTGLAGGMGFFRARSVILPSFVAAHPVLWTHLCSRCDSLKLLLSYLSRGAAPQFCDQPLLVVFF